VEIRLHAFLTSVIDEGEWLGLLMLRPLCHQVPLDRKLGEPKDWLDVKAKRGLWKRRLRVCQKYAVPVFSPGSRCGNILLLLNIKMP
jgi:hypothetical protein